jgi:glycosyltransferase involved in cell wall biosynthesis
LSEPLVSVVIPTYNSEKTLAKCLESIRNQSYRNIEIIVVDKNSEDKTAEIAKDFGAMVIQSNVEMSEARNIGIQYSDQNTKYIMFIDSDMELDSQVIEECVKVAESNPRIGGVVIPEISIGNSLVAKIRRYERSFYAGTEIEAARFFRKDLVEKVGGYDGSIIFYEDHTLPQKIEKLGYNVKLRISREIYHHEEDLTLIKHLKKKYYYGKTARKYITKYKDYAYKQVNFFKRFGLFLGDQRFYSNLSLALGVVILKLLEYFSAGLGFLACED